MVTAAARMPDPAAAQPLVLTTPDGVTLACDRFGTPQRHGLLFTHGFGQTRQAWRQAGQHLAEAGHPGIAMDARGHGESAWLPGGGYEFAQFVDDLLLVRRTLPERAILVGASMGGLIGMLAQAEFGAPFAALILVDITPRWEASGVERILNFMRAHPEGFDSLEHAADTIAAYLPHRTERKSPERLRGLLVPRPDGRLRWHWDPNLLDRIGADGERHQQRLVEAARRIDVPTLLLSGSDSDVVSHRTIDEFLALVPHARHVTVPRATHMVVGDRNDAFTGAVIDFLRTLGDEPG